MLERLEHRHHALAKVSDADILIVVVVATKFFRNHNEQALCVLRVSSYLSGTLSVSRFNRWLHALADWLASLATTVGEVCA